MMKFFRKHRKAVSPVIAVMLLVAVAVAAVGAYFIWFRSFQTQTQKSVQETSEGALGGGLQVINITDDGSKFYVVLKNTLSSGTITLDDTVNINPGNASTKDPGTATISPVGPISAGSTITTTIVPFSVDGNFTLLTGTTRTFTILSDDGTFVVTHTYTDS
ncbi:MAG: hypothetical protein HPY60_03320 [Candidatus Methanofastidiosum sp.]|nr:hypothetical protein [Methanofastidiosum sp.]NYT13598.1 hypothetical protein [Candidatus Methanofastidiosa archaeon]